MKKSKGEFKPPAGYIGTAIGKRLGSPPGTLCMIDLQQTKLVRHQQVGLDNVDSHHDVYLHQVYILDNDNGNNFI